MKPRKKHVSEQCQAISEVLARVGDKWTVLVVSRLGRGSMRFNELKRNVGDISQRMLTLTLRALERDGLVTRTVYPSVPPRVEYELTALGRSLLQPVKSLTGWAMDHREALETSRRKFDAQSARASEAATARAAKPRAA